MADCGISPVGCLKDIGESIITQCLWLPIKSHIDYWWCFDNNIKDLTDGIRDLERKIYDIDQKIEEARLRTDILRPGVEEWSKAGTEKLVEARRILQDDINPKASRWNLISRYSMGKRAKKTAEDIAKHLNDGNNFNVIADPAPPPSTRFATDTSIKYFESRKRIEENIIKSMKESGVGFIGICGMGGVGKTTMAKRIRERVIEEKLFDEVVMVVVSQQIDMLKIQEEIADWLKLKFDERSMSARADKLRTRLMDTKRKIIIFDDVWDRLKLEDLGVPSGFEGCKILLTTRSKKVCDQMEVLNVVSMEILTEDEAWTLFKDKAGNCVEDSDFLSVAKNVVAECKGLPLALVTVGKALRNKRKSEWEDSLLQLRQANPDDFLEFLKDVYNPLKLSYDQLDNKHEKLLFLLCCLFPEDYNIPMEELTSYFMGLRIFDSITSIEYARHRVQRLVENLKGRFLLIDGHNDLYVKMHDIVRDVAIYIGSKVEYCLAKSLNEISIENSSKINWIAVDVSNEPMNVDMDLCFPKLHLLMLLNLSSDISLEGIGDLKVLSFSNISIGSLPPTLALLQNLKTLYLYSCKVEDISVIGKLAGLEILYCRNCYEIKELPAEIGRLNRLRLLELKGCSNLKRIPFGILSSLVRLEELKMLGSFNRWEAEENGKEKRNASVRELESLPNLTCLEIHISNSNLAAQEIRLSPNLVKYFLLIGFDYYWNEERGYEKAMELKLPSEIGEVGKWIQNLVKNTEYLRLEGDGSNNINLEECQHLRNLEIRKCSTLKKVVKTKDCKSGIVFSMLETLRLEDLENIEEIWDGTIILNQNNVSSLSNLKSVRIYNCSNLRYLLSVSVATTCLLQLEELEIRNSEAMEQVFRNDMTYGCIQFPKLKELTLFYLPKLTAFCQGLQTIKFPKLNSFCAFNSETSNPKVEIGGLKSLDVYDLNNDIRNINLEDCKSGINVFPMLESLGLRELDNLEEIWDGTIILNQNVSSLSNLKYLYIYYCSKLRYLFSVSVATTCLLQLEVLEIEFCSAMEQVFRNDNITDGCIEFPKLKKLRLVNLPNLTAFSQGIENIKFPNLTEMRIDELPKLNSLGPLNSETPHDDRNPKVEIGGLESLNVSGLNNIIRNIWCNQIPINFFNNLQELTISYLNGIRSLMSHSIAKNLVSLEYLEINNCEEMVEVIEGDDDDDDHKEVVDFKCLFSTLKTLYLEGLPQLRMFWKRNHALELPLLEGVSIGYCPVMETFTLGSLNTPNLRRLRINGQIIDDHMNDLNDIIHHHFKKLESYPTSSLQE